MDHDAATDEHPRDIDQLAVLVAQTVAGLERTSGGAVLASSVKRAILRKDPTFTESDYGFRAFGELLRHLADRNVIALSEGSAQGDPVVSLPAQGRGDRRLRPAALGGDRPADPRRPGGVVGAEGPTPEGRGPTSARRSSATAGSCSS